MCRGRSCARSSARTRRSSGTNARASRFPRLGRGASKLLDSFRWRAKENTSRERLTLVRLYEELRGLVLGRELRRHSPLCDWLAQGARRALAQAYVPLSFAPGEAYQFDWSHEVVVLNGTTVTVKVAHMRLCHSRMLFARAYPRETQEMVFDAHDQRLRLLQRRVRARHLRNMKTAVETIFVGKERQYNRRFLQSADIISSNPWPARRRRAGRRDRSKTRCWRKASSRRACGSRAMTS